MVMVDMSNVPDTEEFRPVPAGTYKVIFDAKSEETSKNGNTFRNCEFKIIEAPYYGRIIFDRLFYSEASLWRLKVFGKAVGFSKYKEAFDTDDLFKFAKGSELIIKVEIETYFNRAGEEKQKNVVKSFEPSGGGIEEEEEPIKEIQDDFPFGASEQSF